MDTLIELLKDEIRKAKTNVDLAVAEAEKAQARVDSAYDAFFDWKSVFERAMETTEQKERVSEFLDGLFGEAETEKPKRMKRTKPTIADLAEEALREHGPLASVELRNIINASGRDTTTNTVTVTLNRERPDKFDRNGDGKWCLVEHEESGSEDEPGAA